jgi:tetratricopeptide (TPR) repeat protein
MKIQAKVRYIAFIGWVVTLFLNGCEKKPVMDPQKIKEAVSYRNLGLAYLEENMLEEAKSEFLKLAQEVPDEAIGFANLGLVYLRMGRYVEAEEQIKKALVRDPDNPNILLILVSGYELTYREEDALRVLKGSLEHTPRHPRTLYLLAQLYARSSDEGSLSQVEQYLAQLVDYMPANIAIRLQLIDVLLRNGDSQGAALHMDEIRRQMPDLTTDAVDFFERGLSFMKLSRANEALGQVLAFHNLVKPTPLYQAGIYSLRGPAGTSIGFPIVNFSEEFSQQLQREELALATIRFVDVTTAAGLDAVRPLNGRLNPPAEFGSNVTLGDYDGDGDLDVYVPCWCPDLAGSGNLLFRNDDGKFVETSLEAGVRYTGKSVAAIFADYNNDGTLDLYVVNAGPNVLYQNEGDGKFKDVTKTGAVADIAVGHKALFVDIDHEGDLDLYVANSTANRLYRNNGDGNFVELGEKIGIAGENTTTRDAAFGDFDEDGDIDLVIVNENASNLLYTNLRQGYFKDISGKTGLATSGGSGAVAVGDYDNDGFLDLFVTALAGGQYSLFHNQGDGTFEKDISSKTLYAALEGTSGLDAHFLDFDNDGFLDLLVVGRDSKESGKGRGVFLFRNDGTGKFQDASSVLPENLFTARSAAIGDYDEDGDLDLFIADIEGEVRLLRNDGGNVNRWIKVHLLGLSTESGKNNRNSIGAKLEVKAGDLYQMRVVTEPTSHFGLGYRSDADVVRTVWTNGVAQNRFHVRGSQSIVEEQVLKGSCPFLYTWNGEKYVFVKDILWRSALGMPLGIMGSSITYAFPNSANEYVRIPGNLLKPKDGIYTIQITEELWETPYYDQVKLIVVDHPDTADIYVDERFVPPPYPPFHIYTVVHKHTPKSATDEQGNDLLHLIRAQDDLYVSNLTPTRYQGITEIHDLILDLGELSRFDRITLYMEGWIFPTDASINFAISQSSHIKIIPPYLQVKDLKGHWQTVIENLSFPNGKNKMVITDLTDKFLSHDYRVRIRTNMQIYWDHVFFSTDESRIPMREEILHPISADIHYRGFSRMYQKSQYGPHWFDYYDVTTQQRWRDLQGYYTRYGDVTPLLQDADDKYVIMNSGDEITINFDASHAPKLEPRWSRDFVLYSDGWLKDGDFNTAHSQTVDPLPFHGISHYPYELHESYPLDESHRQYLQKYNTRVVSGRAFRSFLLDY